MKSETLKIKHVMYMIKFTIKLKKRKEQNPFSKILLDAIP